MYIYIYIYIYIYLYIRSIANSNKGWCNSHSFTTIAASCSSLSPSNHQRPKRLTWDTKLLYHSLCSLRWAARRRRCAEHSDWSPRFLSHQVSWLFWMQSPPPISQCHQEWILWQKMWELLSWGIGIECQKSKSISKLSQSCWMQNTKSPTKISPAQGSKLL